MASAEYNSLNNALTRLAERFGALESRVARLEAAKAPAPKPAPKPAPAPSYKTHKTHKVGAEGARGLSGVWEKRGKPQPWQTWYDRTSDLNGWLRNTSPVLQVGNTIKVSA